ncbi:MAG: carbohydrate ABC transporter permease [Firmicutes bacterium]|nr:carbohydrate ABC transporter permease [Bacillota bacterium]
MRDSAVSERLLTIMNYILLGLFTLVILIPFWYITVIAFNEGIDTVRGGVYLWPRAFTWDNFLAVFADPLIVRCFANSFLRIALLTPLHLLVVGTAAWAISRKNLVGRKFFVAMFVLSMYVNPGLIPFYLTLAQYRLINNFLVYILPWLFSGW